MCSVRFVNFREHRLIRALGKFRLFIDQSHDVQLLDSNQVQGILIVDEFYVLPIDSLVIVLLLLQFENVLYEELLQILVGIVDAELLETVVIEVLETKNVEHSDRTARLVLGPKYGLVNFLDHVNKQSPVNAFYERVSNIY